MISETIKVKTVPEDQIQNQVMWGLHNKGFNVQRKLINNNRLELIVNKGRSQTKVVLTSDIRHAGVMNLSVDSRIHVAKIPYERNEVITIIVLFFIFTYFKLLFFYIIGLLIHIFARPKYIKNQKINASLENDVFFNVKESLDTILGKESSTQKCWNCFEERNFIDIFCSFCGK